MNEDNDLPDKPDLIGYTVKIDEQLHKRLEKHIHVLKHIEHSGQSKQKWITDAVVQKLAKEESEKISELPKQRYLVLRLNKPINNKIESKVEYQKQFKANFNKKQWILEAIYERLEKEEPKTKKFLEEISQKNRE